MATPTRHLLARPAATFARPAAALACCLVLAGCGVGAAATSDTAEGAVASVASATTGDATAAVATSVVAGDDAVGTLSSTQVHDVDVEFDQGDYEDLLATYEDTGEKVWIEATVTIDGVTYERAGIRLKGNSSLRDLAPSSDEPETLPWLIQLDEFVDGQDHEGLTDLVVRSNTTASALNEAVALELFEQAGLAAQDAIGVRFTVNGSDAQYRLVIENPEQRWMEEEFTTMSTLYKAESTGDWTYRGDDPDAYDDVFDLEAGEDNADLAPLIDLLEFINTSDDETFEAELSDRLDVDSFATYLAMQELVDNFDDIDGPGNNAYLALDSATGQFTIVNWDLNLAFGATNGGGGPAEGGAGTGGPAGGGPGAGAPADAGVPGAGGPGGGGPEAAVGDNPLVERFLAVDAWSDLVDERLDELQVALVDSGIAEQVTTDWATLVTSADLVEADVVATEAEAVRASLATVD